MSSRSFGFGRTGCNSRAEKSLHGQLQLGDEVVGALHHVPERHAELELGAELEVERPHRSPILIAGTGLTLTIPIVAHHADAWHAQFPDRPAELEPAVAALRRACDEIGRDPAEIEWSVGLEPDDADRFLAEDVDAYLEMGFTQFTLGFGGPTWPVEQGAPWLPWRDRMNAMRAQSPSFTGRH